MYMLRQYQSLIFSIFPIFFLLACPTWAVATSTQLPLYVKETTGVARQNEVVRSGVPIPRALNVLNVNGLTLVNEAGVPVPAEFQITGRWNAGLANTKAPAQWLLVTFQSSVAGKGMAKYSLITDGSAGANPAPSTAIKLDSSGGQITVNTGKAIFKVGKNKNSLFDEIKLSNGTKLASAASLSAQIDGTLTQHTKTLRRIWVEHKGPLIAIVVVEGVYDLPAKGGGQVSSARRYIFTAGSEVALVRHVVRWEGDLCAGNGWDLTCDWNQDGVAKPNALLVSRISDPLQLNLGLPLEATVIGNFDQAEVVNSLTPGQAAFVSQKLRNTNLDSLTYSLQIGAANAKIGKAITGGVLAVKGQNGTVAVALNHMHRYEPQTLRLSTNPTATLDSTTGTATIEVDIADDKVWLGQRQGMFANFAVGAFDLPPTRDTLNQVVWAALNHPLHAMPTPYWLGNSGEAIPKTAWPASYDKVVPKILNTTLNKINEKGLSGLMTFGLYPRYWGTGTYGDEINCGTDEPTPDMTWDNLYWCTTWTDYHNTSVIPAKWALRSGDPSWLDEMSFPAAQRMLFTQINQCSPNDGWFYCGQAPAGYGGYRVDFNSSHGYFENLQLYYWLTGDYAVVEILNRGASLMRNYVCSKRPAKPCLNTDPETDIYSGFTGRVASQWNLVFRFIGLTSKDASFLQDWKSNLGRAVTQNYVESVTQNVSYGFLGDTAFNGAGTYVSSQLWMASMYDMKRIYEYAVETNNAPLGTPAVLPMDVIAAWARTLVDFGATVSGDGSAGGKWPNSLNFTMSGARIGGNLVGVTGNTTGGDPYLYNSGKTGLIAPLTHAGDYLVTDEFKKMRNKLLVLTQTAALTAGPLNKEQGEYMSSLPDAHEIVWGRGAGY